LVAGKPNYCNFNQSLHGSYYVVTSGGDDMPTTLHLLLKVQDISV